MVGAVRSTRPPVADDLGHSVKKSLMTNPQTLAPARQLAETNQARFPNESTEYRAARNALLAVSDAPGEYTRTYVSPEDADVPGFSVFTRRDGIIRHFYTGEMSGAMADPGQDPRGGPDLDPLWLMLDLTPGGRGTDWYPKLDYGHNAPTSQHVGQGR